MPRRCKYKTVEDSIRGALAYDPDSGLITRVSSGRVMSGLNRDGYIEVRISFAGRYVDRMAHRIAWFKHYGEWPIGDIDHMNRNKLDNRIENLCIVTKEANNENRESAPRFAVHGVEVGYGGKFTSRSKHKGKYVHHGTFDTYDEAVAAKLGFKECR